MFNYREIKEKNVIIIQEPEKMYDINFLIPVRGRREFAEPMYQSFLKAKGMSSLSVVYTVIEHSVTPDHAKFCKKNNLSYIWIKSKEGELFNKCLCYNMGALYSNISKYIIFHDLDCLIQSDFFMKVSLNLHNQKCKALQCFKERRVLYCNESLTGEIIANKVSVDDLSLNHTGVDLPRLGGKVMLGAPGGSILIERELFYNVGGYDDHLFLANSPEDAYFWEKIETVDKMCLSEQPGIDIFHLFHQPTYFSNPHINEMKKTFEDFKKSSKEEKEAIIQEKREHFKQFIS